MTALPQAVAITPAHRVDAAIAIAACRAGKAGLLDLGLAQDEGQAKREITRLFSYASRGEKALRLDTRNPLCEAILSWENPWDLLVLAGPGAADFRPKAKGTSKRVFKEASSLEEAFSAEKEGFDGVLVKAHEAGGDVAVESALVLAQALSQHISLPYWIMGGAGPGAMAALALAGASALVFSESLWALKEAPFSPEEKSRFRALDGSQTRLLGPFDAPFRVFARQNPSFLDALEKECALGAAPWRGILTKALFSAEPPMPMGQEIAFCDTFASRYGRVGPLLLAMEREAQAQLLAVRAQAPIAPDSPFAQEHRIRYPIFQGPMTRVSDVPGFALAVAKAGALPFLALALLRGDEVHKLLSETQALLGDLPWGVGILGFVPLALREEQLAQVRSVRPPFAIVAGGRPAHARELEKEGIKTYLHVPSPGLLRTFVRDGARKFIFEGSECGGHVGPRTSFILWQSAVDTLLQSGIEDWENLHIVFAGGIHDALSAAMAAAIAAPLVEKGARFGLLMGTAYLFTEEAVATGAILPGFQEAALACEGTVLLESGAGHATRCAKGPFAEEFGRVKKELVSQGRPPEEIQRALEDLNVGRLRIASKGIMRNREAEKTGKKFIEVSPEEQKRLGMVMIGEVAALRRQVVPMACLHGDVAEDGQRRLQEMAFPAPAVKRRAYLDDDIAIVGMAGMFPEAENVRQYWENIIKKVDAISEVPALRWNIEVFYHPDKKAPDRTYSKWGGFLQDLAFDPLKYGLPPAVVPHVEPTFLIALEVARLALEDAGWETYPFPKAKTAAIFGLGGMHDLGMDYVFRTLLMHYLSRSPEIDFDARQEVLSKLYDKLPHWTEDSFPGILGNVAAGRIANRLNLTGSNFTVDAACGTSLAAILTGIQQLRLGTCEVALVGAMDGTTNATGFVSFGKTQALSPRGRCRSFDDSADGIAISDGVGALVLKRLADAEASGDRIYGLIKGIGSSSDGRARSMTAPDPNGQKLAVRRAYEDAGLSPATITLMEAHGTGTKVGDRVEVQALNEVFGESCEDKRFCAIGSVKSMIGHTKVAAGMASLIKCLLALHHRVLPPTLHVEKPNTFIDFATSPFYINASSRPWAELLKAPRRAAISAFGFGGTNFHAIAEEYQGNYLNETFNWQPRDAEVFVFSAEDVPALASQVQKTLNAACAGHLSASQVAQSLWVEAKGHPRQARLVAVAENLNDLAAKLKGALAHLQTHSPLPEGVFFGGGQALGKLAFLFPGQGAQRLDMLKDLVLGEPRFAQVFSLADHVLGGDRPLSFKIFPPFAFNEEERQRNTAALNDTIWTQPALAVVEAFALQLLSHYKIFPQMVAGHSFGEYTALFAAGVFSLKDFLEVARFRGEIASEASRQYQSAMLAVQKDPEAVQEVLSSLSGVYLANLNAPDQSIVAGKTEEVEAARKIFAARGWQARQLPVSCAFHVPEMQEAGEKLTQFLQDRNLGQMRLPVYSNTLAGLYPQDARAMADLLGKHMAAPVLFAREIEKMHEDGARIFVEVGPGRALTNLVSKILSGKPHLALFLEHPDRGGYAQMGRLLAGLFASGVEVDFSAWFADRGYLQLPLLDAQKRVQEKEKKAPTTWRLNPGYAFPWNAPLPEVRVSPVFAEKKGEANAKMPKAPPEKSIPAVKIPTPVPINHQQSQRINPMEWREPSPQTELAPQVPHDQGVLAQVQANIAQFLELERGRQRIMERFLDMQERVLQAYLGAPLPPQALPSLAREEMAPPAVMQPQAARPRPAPVPTAADVAQVKKPAAAAVAPAPKVVGIPQPAKEAPKVPVPSGDGAADVESFKKELLQAVAARTGFPPEMLDLNLNMEADLGIDSIKKVEIFSELREHHDVLQVQDEEKTLEEISGLRTLGSIIDWYKKNKEAMSGQKKN